MIKTKKDLINKIKNLSDNLIKQGIQFRHLSLSIEQRKDEKTLKEWKEEIRPTRDKLTLERGKLKIKWN